MHYKTATQWIASATISIFALLSHTAALAQAPVHIQDPWVRATVPGQKATGAFMTLTASGDWRLVGVKSPVSGIAQVHEMSMKEGVMRMAEVAGGLPLPKGQAVQLKPGGFHLMLMDLKSAAKVGEVVPLTLTFKAANGRTETMEVQAPVRPLGGKAPAAHGHSGHDMKAHQ
jgi:copper(I)-binding protein